MSKPVVVIDYGVGNVFSVCNALSHIGALPILTNDPKLIAKAERVILPGVGAFSHAIKNLIELDLDNAIYDFVSTGRPLLGICIGMQLLMDASSEYGFHKGLGLIPGSVENIKNRFLFEKKVKVPHIGWAPVTIDKNMTHHKVTANANHKDFYFVHSFSCNPYDEEHLLGWVKYNGTELTAIIGKNNILGVQFHPERSGSNGLDILSRFAQL